MKLPGLFAGLALALILLPALSACDYERRAVPPPSSDIGNTVGELYLRAGAATQIVKSEILGKHYQPGRDTWKVIACTEFNLADGGNGRDCNDSFELYRLDSGKWMLNGTVNGGYLWVEML